MRRPSAATIIASAAGCCSITRARIVASRYMITSASQIMPSVIASLRGLTGARRPAGTFSASDLETEMGPQTTVVGVGTGSMDATCPPGTTVVSGGYGSTIVDGDIAINEADGNNGWFVEGANDTSELSPYVTAIVVCAS